MKRYLLMMTVLLLFPSIGRGTEKGEAITVELGKKFQLASTVLGEQRDVLIRVPDGYRKTTDRYPVIYVLDGNSHFRHVANAVKILQRNGRMPDAIVVAIPNNGNRNRDLSFQKDRFKRFINDELVPMIDRTYRTSGHKTLFGHSMAGSFTLYMLATEPASFHDFIAASPVIHADNAELLTLFPALFAQKRKLEKSLYFTLTSVASEGPAATNALNKFVALLKKTAPPELDWHYNFIPNQAHMTTPYLTAYEGLSVLFHNFQIPNLASHQEFKDYGGLEGIRAHYARRGEKYGVSKEIPAAAFRTIGWMLIDDQQAEAGLQIFRENIKRNPQSPGAFAVLGSALAELNRKQEALETFRTGLKLAGERSQIGGFLSRRVNELARELEK